MNAEELYDAFAQIDDDLLDGTTGTVLRVRTINPRRIVAAAIALFVVGAGVTAVYLIHDGRANKPGIDGVIQSDYPREVSAVDGEIPLLTAETYDEYVIFLHTNECAKQIVRVHVRKME